ncbi:MAG: hypothetical protein P8170_04405 [Gemmatimonadota bacterium]
MQTRNRTTTRKGALATMGMAVGVALTASACSETTAPDALDDILLNDLAVVAADATLEDITLMGAGFDFGLHAAGDVGDGPGMLGGHMGIGGTFSGTRSVTFYDADGDEQPGYDEVTTAAIRVEMELAGERTREWWSANITRARSMVISGLEGEESTRQLDGSGTETVTRSRHLDDGSERTHDMTGEFFYEGVVVPIPGSEPRWPLAGTVRRTVHVSVTNGLGGDLERDVEIVVTFDGDETATAVINGETVEIDLSTREGGHPLNGRLGRHGG